MKWVKLVKYLLWVLVSSLFLSKLINLRLVMCRLVLISICCMVVLVSVLFGWVLLFGSL